jgi:DNA polymerase-3 subunit alpha
MTLGQQQRRMREIGQNSLFGGGESAAHDDFVLPDVPDHPQQQLLAWEKELLNLYLSAHPLAHVAAILKRRATTSTAYLNEEWAGQKVTLGGRITEIRRIMTKRGDTMAAVQLEDLQGSIEVVVFPKVYAATAASWHEDAIVLVTGSVKLRDDEPQLVCDSVEEFIPTDEEINHKEYLLKIRVPRGRSDALEIARIDQLLTALNRYPGEDRFELRVRNGRWEALLVQLSGQAGVQVCPELMLRLEEILGPGAVEAVPLMPVPTGPMPVGS